MKHGTYVGPIDCLRGKTATMRYSPDGDSVLAQFDERELVAPAEALGLPREGVPDARVGCSWYVFQSNHFEVLPE